MKKAGLAVVIILAIILIIVYVLFKPKIGHQTTAKSTKPAATKAADQSKDQANSFDKKQLSIDEPTSLWVVVNKRRPLKQTTYRPADLVVPKVPLRIPGNESMQIRQAAATALETMFAAAKEDGVQLNLSSAYRSYQYQSGLYGGYVKSKGVTYADTISARAGYSEHQTGLAADIRPMDGRCEVEVCFADLPEGKWLAAHAYSYGFVLRYPKDDTPTTGYAYEPWHFRYVGKELAQAMHAQHISTLEQFFDLGAAPDYGQ